LSEVYIYRYFMDREDLFRQAFLSEDKKLAEKIKAEYSSVDFSEKDYHEKISSLLNIIWAAFNDNKESTLFFYHYYYSIQMISASFEHYQIWSNFIKTVAKDFPNATNIRRLTDSLLEGILNFSAKIHLDFDEDSEELRQFGVDITVPFVAHSLGIKD